MYYGESYIEENLDYKLLQEFTVTKKDLEDPNYLNKIQKKVQDTTNNVYKASFILSISLNILTAFLISPIFMIGTFVPFIISGILLGLKIVEILPSYDKRRKQIKDKVIKIKEKAEKMKDCKEKQEIIKNCDNLLKKIDKEISDQENQERVKYIKQVSSIYNDIYKLYTTGKIDLNFIYDYDHFVNMFYIADKYLTINIRDLDKKFWQNADKNYKSDDSIIQTWFGYKNSNDLKEDDKDICIELSKAIVEFKNDDKIYLFGAIDDTMAAYLPKTKAIYYGDYAVNSNEAKKYLYKSLISLYQYFSKYTTLVDSEDIKGMNKEKFLTILSMVDKYNLMKK